MKGKETRQEFKPIMEELIDNAYADLCTIQKILRKNTIIYCSRKQNSPESVFMQCQAR